MLTIFNDKTRAEAIAIARAAPDGTRVEFRGPKRSTDQNRRMWAMLTDIALQVPWTEDGGKMTTHEWKDVFLAGLHREYRLVPNLDRDRLIAVGRSSSNLSKQEMSDMIELMHAFGAKRGVVFHDPRAE